MSAALHTQQVRVLYKIILKLHRGLPAEMQSLGNNYVRDEFRRHKHCNSSETKIFMKEWANYAVLLAQQLSSMGPATIGNQIGKNLGDNALQQLSDHQVYQLYQLMLATTQTTSDDNRDG